eukprot:Colp12_sorted_trinity150504_noHs@21685
MAKIIHANYKESAYRDQRFKGSENELDEKLKTSTTLYVGNLSFYTTEEQIYELFSKCGEVRRIIMGLDKFKRTPCGFCFVEFYTRKDAEDAMKYVNGTKLDDRIVRSDWDAGFVEGRQYGRGKSGGQVRDEYRVDYDAGRGGYGAAGQRVDSPDPSGKPAYAFSPAGGTPRGFERNEKRDDRRSDRRSGDNRRASDSGAKTNNPRFRRGDGDSDSDA